MTTEKPPPSRFERRYSAAWIGLALSILSVAGMIWAYSQVQRKAVNPGSHSQRDVALLGEVLVTYMTFPFLGLSLIAFTIGLVSLISHLRRNRGVAVPIITLVLCVFAIGSFAALWSGWL